MDDERSRKELVLGDSDKASAIELDEQHARRFTDNVLDPGNGNGNGCIFMIG